VEESQYQPEVVSNPLTVEESQYQPEVVSNPLTVEERVSTIQRD
jgi:hypothetical protein